MTKRILSLLAVGTFLMTGCTQPISQTPGTTTEKSDQSTSVQKTSLEILPAGKTTEQTSTPGVTKISSGSGFRFGPKIYGNYAAWQESPTLNSQTETLDLYLYDLSKSQLKRVGITKSLFGNDVAVDESDFTTHDQYNRGAASFNNSFLVWNEINPKGEVSDSGVYYSPLGGKLEKNLIVKGVYLNPGDGLSSLLDGNTFYYALPQIVDGLIAPGESQVMEAFDLATSKKLPQIPWEEFMKKLPKEDFVSIYDNSSAVKAGTLPPSSDSKIRGFARSGDNLLVVIASGDQNIDLFVLNLKDGSVKNPLEKSNIHPSPIMREDYIKGMMNGNKIIFAGFEGTLKEDFSNIDIYVATL